MSLKEWNLDLEEKNFQLHAFIMLFVHEHRVSLSLALAFPLKLEFHSYVLRVNFPFLFYWLQYLGSLHFRFTLAACVQTKP